MLWSLQWWTYPVLGKGCAFRELSHITITSDASLFGWVGSHLWSHMAQGYWTQADLSHNINWLELWVAHLVLWHFRDLIQGQHILTNNVRAKAHINCQVGTHSQVLMMKAEQLGGDAFDFPQSRAHCGTCKDIDRLP